MHETEQLQRLTYWGNAIRFWKAPCPNCVGNGTCFWLSLPIYDCGWKVTPQSRKCDPNPQRLKKQSAEESGQCEHAA